MEKKNFIRTSDQDTVKKLLAEGFTLIHNEGNVFCFLNNGNMKFSDNENKIVYTNILNMQEELMHRIMTLDDLYNYYSSQEKSLTFSYEETNEPIVVQVDGNMHFSDSENDKDGLYSTRVQMNFIGDNLNGSRIEMKAQKSANSSAKYRPLLACIHEVDGEPQFYGHNYHEDDDGKIVYDEQPVGVIIEEAHIEHDDEFNKDYAVANGYIWEEYSDAKYILERDKKCDVSVELSIRSLSYNATDKILVLDDFYYAGCTILGVDDNGNKVKPAMPGSNITLSDFSEKNNSMIPEDKLIATLDKLNETLAKFNIQAGDPANTKEGGNEKVTKFEELLKQYEKTVEDITFEYENLSDEELETVFAEAFADAEPEGDPEPNDDPEPTNDPEPANEPEGGAPEDNIGTDEFSVKYSIEIGDTKKEFSLSLNDKLNAMYALVNETYGEVDNEWYDVNMFDDDKYVEMYGLFTGKNYRQEYTCKKDKYQLKGDRTQVFAKFLTQDEINAFEKMKSDFAELQTTYSEVSDKLAKYEAEPQKMEILNSDAYSQIAESEEFAALKEQNAHFNMSVDEVQAKADELLLEFAKSGKLEFAVENNNANSVGIKMLPLESKKSSRYGDLFSK